MSDAANYDVQAPGAHGPVRKTSSVTWKERTGKKIPIASGHTELSVVLVVGETNTESQPIFCLTLREKPVVSKWNKSVVTLNKAECDWLLSNIDQLVADVEVEHVTENKHGEKIRTLHVVKKKAAKGSTTICFNQKKNGGVYNLSVPKTRVPMLKKYISEAMAEYQNLVKEPTCETQL